jgi:hypothetical protein
MKRISLLAAACVCAFALVSASSASAAGGKVCGGTEATDKAGNTAKFKVKSYDVGCNRAEKGVRRYFRQTNGEKGEKLVIKGYTCGPLQEYDKGELAFQCRSNHGASKRYKALWKKPPR